ncbi:MAG: hypothetical protein AB7O74_17565 [Candidatus Nanopelagicales bacterium]
MGGRSDGALEYSNARRERRHVSRDLAEHTHDAIAFREDEVTGYGSSARWA